MKRLLRTLTLLCSATAFSQQVLFTEDFETPVVPSGYNEGSTPSAWVRASVGFNASRHGLNRIGDGQVYSFRYTNSGITTDDGEIGTIDLYFAEYELSFDVMQDQTSTEIAYTAILFAAPLGITKNDCSGGFLTPAGSVELARVSGNAPADGSTNRVTLTFDTNPYMSELDGYDLGIRIFGATSSANIDNVQVIYSHLAQKFVVVGNKLVRATSKGVSTFPLWTPDYMSTLAWYDAADTETITENAGSISQWNDKSGNERNLVQLTGAWQPDIGVRTLNGLNVVDFDNSDRIDSTQWFNPEDGFHFFVVFKLDTVPVSSEPLIQNRPGNGIGRTILYGHSGGKFRTFLGATGTPLTNLNYAANNMSISATAGASSNDIESWWHGVEGVGATVNIEPNNNSAIRFGGDNNGVNWWDGYMAEFVAVPSGVTEDTRQKMEGYLAWKWGLTENLPSDHPYKSFPPLYESWSPADIETVAWYDAADVSTITYSVAPAISQWDDKSGSGYDMGQLDGGYQPEAGTREVNGLNAIDFTPSDVLANSSLGSALSGLNKEFSVFVVSKVDTFASAQYIWMLGSSTDNDPLVILGKDSQVTGNGWRVFFRNDDATSSKDFDTTVADTDVNIISVIMDSTNVDADLNGSDLYAGNRSVTGSQTMNNFAIGALDRISIGAGLDGLVGEVIVIDGTVNEDTRQRIEGYLAWKWGLRESFPSGHPYKYVRPSK